LNLSPAWSNDLLLPSDLTVVNQSINQSAKAKLAKSSFEQTQREAMLHIPEKKGQGTITTPSLYLAYR